LCEAERLGYDWAAVSGHFTANPGFGARDNDRWNEAWKSVSALAEATTRIHVGVLLTRARSGHPALLAKMPARLVVI